MERKNGGITLIALIITIIIMLILAGIVLSLTLGENGIIGRAQESGIEYKKAEIKEEIETAILSIQMGLVEQGKEGGLSNEAIINQLPKEIEDIIVNNDMTGEYKEHEYWIDEEYKVHIGEKINNPIQVRLFDDYVGTASATIRVEASSTKGNIVSYQYEIEGKETIQVNEPTYTIEELEPEAKYTIKVLVTDEQGNQRRSMPITITTKQKSYVVKDGIWNVEKNLGNATIKIENGYCKVAIDSTENRGGFWFNCDFINYKAIKMDVEIVKKEIATSGSSVGFAIWKQPATPMYGNENYIKGKTIIGHNETSKPRNVYEIDIQNLTGRIYGIFNEKCNISSNKCCISYI